MKSEIKIMKELEEKLSQEINQKIMDLIYVKFGNKISEYVSFKINSLIQQHLNETIWLDQMKDNLNTFITEYTKDLCEQKQLLNARMDCIEQHLLNCMEIMTKHKLLIKSPISIADLI